MPTSAELAEEKRELRAVLDAVTKERDELRVAILDALCLMELNGVHSDTISELKERPAVKRARED